MLKDLEEVDLYCLNASETGMGDKEYLPLKADDILLKSVEELQVELTLDPDMDYGDPKQIIDENTFFTIYLQYIAVERYRRAITGMRKGVSLDGKTSLLRTEFMFLLKSCAKGYRLILCIF